MIFDDYQLITSENKKYRTIKYTNSQLELQETRTTGNIIWDTRSGTIKFKKRDKEFIEKINSQIEIKSILKKVTPGYEYQFMLRVMANCFLAVGVMCLLIYLTKSQQFELTLLVSILYASFLMYQRFRNQRWKNRNFWKKVRFILVDFSKQIKDKVDDGVRMEVEIQRNEVVFEFLDNTTVKKTKDLDDRGLFSTLDFD